MEGWNQKGRMIIITERISQFIKELKERSIARRIPLSASVYVTDERLPLKDTINLERRPIQPGTEWGRNWRSGYFLLEADVPDDFPSSDTFLSADFGGEVQIYDDEGNAIWPKMIINYTSKTQCLFRISKGTLDILDDDTVNKKIETKRVEFHNMIYIGDGITDIPCMTLIKERHGLSIAVYKSGNSETAAPLVDDKRVDASVTADYRENSKLDKLVKAKIDLVALSNH